MVLLHVASYGAPYGRTSTATATSMETTTRIERGSGRSPPAIESELESSVLETLSLLEIGRAPFDSGGDPPHLWRRFKTHRATPLATSPRNVSHVLSCNRRTGFEESEARRGSQ